MTEPAALVGWHRLVHERDPAQLADLIAEDAVFHSPIVHSPQRGKKLVCWYLYAAVKVLFNDTFKYVREIREGDAAVLEFQVEVDGITVNGVDMITWNEQGKIVDFKVMLRPLKAINLVHQKMAQMLEAAK